MRFTDFLKNTVLLSAAAATMLALVTVFSATAASQPQIAVITAGWWVLAAVIGLATGRRSETSGAIAQLLAGARATMTLPEHRPAAILLNRLWPLLVLTVVAGGLGLLAPQIPGIGAGFTIIWALAWRKQHRAVAAIEERDGVRFYVMETSPVRKMALQRTPGFRAIQPEGVR